MAHIRTMASGSGSPEPADAVVATSPSSRAEAQRLLDRVEADPERAHASALVLAERHARDPGVASRFLWVAGVASRMMGDLKHASDELDDALRLAEQAGDRSAAGLIHSSRAMPLLFSGQTEAAMHELDLADALVRAPADRAFCLYQRAGLLTRLGRNEEAERCYLEAIPALRTAGYRVYEANSLTNVGIARTFRGDCRHGREDFLAAHRIFVSLRLPGAVAVSEHNLGFVASRAGDLNTAFEHFERARRRHVRSKLPLGPLIVDHCEALLAAGLAEEAYARLCDLLPELEDASQEVDRADALLLAATAALRARTGRPKPSSGPSPHAPSSRPRTDSVGRTSRRSSHSKHGSVARTARTSYRAATWPRPTSWRSACGPPGSTSPRSTLAFSAPSSIAE